MTTRPDTPVANENDDLALIMRYAETGDREAMGALFSRHAEFAYRVALRVTGNSADAEDAVQSAFVKIMKTASLYKGGAGVKVWMMKIVVGTCRDAIRSAARRRERETQAAETTQASDSGAIFSRELGDAVMRTLSQLPVKYRLAIWLRHYEGLSFEEMADSLSASEHTLRSRVNRGMNMLRRKLAATGASLPAITPLESILRACPAESAPAAIMEEISRLVVQGAAGIGAGAPLSASTQISRWLALSNIRRASFLALLLVFASGAGLLWRHATTRTEKPATIRAPHVIRRWDFNTPDIPPELEVTIGRWHHLPDGGPDGSGCMETDDFLASVLLDVPLADLPVEIRYRVSMVPRGRAAHDMFRERVEWGPPMSAVAHFFGLGEHIRMAVAAGAPTTPWIERREYVTADYIDRWRQGKRNDLTIYDKRRPDSRLHLGFRNFHRIDDLEIHRIRHEDLPNVVPLLEALRNIPASERIGEVPLPDIPSGVSGATVRVVFHALPEKASAEGMFLER